MKTKHELLFGIAAIVLAAAFILTGCPDTSDDKEPEKAVTPTANPAMREVASGTEITLATATEGAAIYYTLDGSNPTASSAKYEETAKPTIVSNTTLKAIAVKAGMTDSDMLTAAYTVKTATPTANPAAGEIASGTEITLTTATAGAAIYYTLDGSNPTASSTKYADTKPRIVSNTTLKAIAVKAGMTDSDMLTAAYTILTPVPDVFAVDISQETDWNYMIVGKDGSSMFFNADESTGIPTLLYLKPEKDSDAGFTYLFKENGLVDKIIANGYVLYFGNYNGYKFDMAIIYPDDAIEYHYDIETDVNFDAYNETPPAVQSRSILGWLFGYDKLDWSDAIGVVSCGTSWIPGLNTLTAPLCGSYVIGELTHGAIEVIDIFVPDDQLGSLTMNVLRTLVDAYDCLTTDDVDDMVTLLSGAQSCVAGMASMYKLLTDLDLGVVNQKIEQIDEAIRRIEGDALKTTVIPHDLLEDLLLLGIEVNHGRNPPNIEGTYLMSPSVLVRSNFSDGNSPGYQFSDVQLTFSSQDNAKMTVDVSFIQGDSIANGINSFITGEGTKFSVFSEMNYTDGSQSVYIYSGEITSSGIRNHSRALIMTVEGTNTIRRGQGRLIYDSDGFSEKTADSSSRSAYGQSRSALPPENSRRH